MLQKAVDETINNYEAMTHLIHCIGTMLPVATIRNVPMTEFRRAFDINFFSTVDLLQRCLPHLSGPSVGDSGQRQSKPKVIIVSSGADFEVQYRGWSGYCTSKAALTRLIHLLAHEESEIDVFGVLPQVTKSPMTDKIVNGDYDQVMSSEERARFTRWLSEGRFEPARYIGGAIVKAAMGDMSPDSAEIERNVCGALFIGSLYQKSDSFGQG